MRASWARDVMPSFCLTGERPTSWGELWPRLRGLSVTARDCQLRPTGASSKRACSVVVSMCVTRASGEPAESGGLTGGPVAVIRRAHRRCATGAQGTSTRRPTGPERVCPSSCAGFAGKVRRPGRVCGDGSHLVLDTSVRPVRRRDGQHRQDHLGAPDRRGAPGQGGEAIRPHGSMTAPRRCRLRDGEGRRPASPSPTLGPRPG
jgi:hypothetical protein